MWLSPEEDRGRAGAVQDELPGGNLTPPPPPPMNDGGSVAGRWGTRSCLWIYLAG